MFLCNNFDVCRQSKIRNTLLVHLSGLRVKDEIKKLIRTKRLLPTDMVELVVYLQDSLDTLLDGSVFSVVLHFSDEFLILVFYLSEDFTRRL